MNFSIRFPALQAFLFMGFACSAQLDNSMLGDRAEMSDSSTWGFSISNFNYLRNTEYFNDIELGRTLFGYQLSPSLFVQPNRFVKLQAGAFVRHDFGGANPYTEALPTFSLNLQRGNFSATFGTLDGALSHRIIEPMFDINSAIEKRIENGVDVRFNGTGSEHFPKERRSFYNMWINWEKFIQRGSPYKEGFTAGVNLDPRFLRAYTLVYPVFQSMMTHRGGQIDSDSSNMTMQINSAVGLKTVLGLTLNTFTPEVYYLNYRETSNSGYFPYKNGNAWYGNLSYKHENPGSAARFILMLSYFNGHQFISPRGTPIYQSVSLDKPGLTERDRELLFVRFIYQKRITGFLNLDARVEPVYDLRNKILDYSYSLYLVCRINKAFAY